MLGPRQEELLSYMQGLAPVGEPIEVPIRHVMADLQFRCRATFYQRLNQLIQHRLVRRIACGCNQTTGVLVVLRRLESVGYADVSEWPARHVRIVTAHEPPRPRRLVAYAGREAA